MISAAMPAITGLNHITLAVHDLEGSIAFYRDLLGCKLRAHWPDGAYLEAGTLWLCLSRDDAAEPGARADYTHLAFSVDATDFAALGDRIRAACPIWKENRSEGDSLYFLDPDGHKLELHIGSLATRLDHYRQRVDDDITIV
jgi:catechol 2,3-dioxygenase-like lactoylglutathione lyase family enzyme